MVKLREQFRDVLQVRNINKDMTIDVLRICIPHNNTIV